MIMTASRRTACYISALCKRMLSAFPAQTMEQLKSMRRKISVEKEQTSYELNPSEPCFTAKHLGKIAVTEKFSPSNGYTLCANYTEQLLRNKKSGKSLRKLEILISRNIYRGLSLSDPLGKVQEETFQLQNIAFCTTIKKHPKVFTFIAEQDGKLQCHAFLCSKEAKAKALCLAVTRAFTLAYDEWSRKRTRLVKKKERRAKEAVVHDLITADQNPNNEPNSEEDDDDDGGDDDFKEFAKNRLHTQDLEELESNLEVMDLVRGDRSASEGTESSANDENIDLKD